MKIVPRPLLARLVGSSLPQLPPPDPIERTPLYAPTVVAALSGEALRYTMSRELTTVPEMWREWTGGVELPVCGAA